MKKYTLGKKILAASLLAVLAFTSLAGCAGGSGGASNYSQEEYATTKVMKVGEQDIYLDEVNFYIIQELIMQGASPKTISVNEEAYKNEVLAMIRERVIMYNVVVNNDVELEQEDLDTAKTLEDNFRALVPQEVLDEYGISDDLIRRLFQEQAAIEKFQAEIQSDMGEQIYNDFLEAYADYSFHEAYYMIFPTVEVDDEGNPKTSDEAASNGGTAYVYLSDEEKAKVKENAEAAVAELRSGKDVDAVAEAYGVTPYSSELSGYVGMYSDDMNQALDGLKTGECTDVMEDVLGYTVTYMRSADNEDLKATYVYYLATENLNIEYETLRQRWLSTIAVDPVNDMEGDVWENYSLSVVLDSLVDAGVLFE